MSSLISLFDVRPLWEPLTSGQLILTPNQRLASRIRSAFAIASAEAGNNVVFTPAVYSINQWIEQCWLDLLMNADPRATSVTVLSANQEQALWGENSCGIQLWVRFTAAIRNGAAGDCSL